MASGGDAAVPKAAGASAADADKAKEFQEAIEKVGSSLGLVEKGADLMKKLFHQSSSTKIDEKQRGRGFEKAEAVAFTAKAEGIAKSDIPSWFTSQFDTGTQQSPAMADRWQSKNGQLQRTKLQQAVETNIVRSLRGGRFSESGLLFQAHGNVGGYMYCLVLNARRFQPDPTDAYEQEQVKAALEKKDPLMELTITILFGGFTLMPDLIYLTHEESDFFSSESWVEIREMPRGVESGDVLDFMRILFQPLAIIETRDLGFQPITHKKIE